MSINYRKGQVWFSDFTIAIVVFFAAVLIYILYIGNLGKDTNAELVDVSTHSKLISSFLMDTGFPDAWYGNVSKTRRIGLTGGKSDLLWWKFRGMFKFNYSQAKHLLNSRYDFFIFFQDKNKNVLNVGGNCGYGHPEVEANLTAPTIGWLSPTRGNGPPYNNNSYVFIPPNIHIYRPEKSGIVMLGMNASELFLHNLSQRNDDGTPVFDIIYVEGFNYNKSKRDNLSTYIEEGGKMFLFDWWCHEDYQGCSDGKSYSELGVNFTNTVDVNLNITPDGIVNATVIEVDEFLNLNIGNDFIFNGNGEEIIELNAVSALPNTSQFSGIAVYTNHPNSDMNQLFPYKTTAPWAVARWRFGAGWAYFTPLNVTNLTVGNNTCTDCVNHYLDEYDAAAEILAGKCNEINMSKINFKHLVPTERLVLYDNQLIKMVVYAWR